MGGLHWADEAHFLPKPISLGEKIPGWQRCSAVSEIASRIYWDIQGHG